MQTAYLFDERRGESVDSWTRAFQDLSDDQVLWLDLASPSDGELEEIAESLEVGDVDLSDFDAPERRLRFEQHDEYLGLTVVAVSDKQRDPDQELVAVDCFVGSNWVLSSHTAAVEALDDFREIVSGEGEIGILDAPSFLAALLEWVVTSYLPRSTRSRQRSRTSMWARSRRRARIPRNRSGCSSRPDAESAGCVGPSRRTESSSRH
jgi:Mg2+ and Co2+ transporter CorA